MTYNRQKQNKKLFFLPSTEGRSPPRKLEASLIVEGYHTLEQQILLEIWMDKGWEEGGKEEVVGETVFFFPNLSSSFSSYY